jgi:Two-component sensor kinase N-terminal
MPAREQRSLFGEILDWMLAPLLLLWPMSVALTWVVAQSIAHRPYDRELGELARTIARQASAEAAVPAVAPRQLQRDLEQTVTRLLRPDDNDSLFFQVLGTRGELVAGDADLPVPVDARPGVELRFRDDVIREAPTSGRRWTARAWCWCSWPRRWTSARSSPPRSSRA